MNNNLTYAKSGVNIKKSNEFIKLISLLSKKHQKVVILRILGVLEQLTGFQIT